MLPSPRGLQNLKKVSIQESDKIWKQAPTLYKDFIKLFKEKSPCLEIMIPFENRLYSSMENFAKTMARNAELSNKLLKCARIGQGEMAGR